MRRFGGLAAALAALASLLVGLAVLAAPTPAPQESHQPADSLVVSLRVIGPDGAPLWPEASHVLEAGNATALEPLLAGAADAGMVVETESYPGMGTYVRAIGEHRARGASGWLYEVERDGQVLRGDRAADAFGLAAGDTLVWRWSADGA